MRGKAVAIIDAVMPEPHEAPGPIRLGSGYNLGWIDGSGPVVWGPSLSVRFNALPADAGIEEK